MKVILKENVDALGRIGDVVKVSDGYARNYLLPRKLALIADEKNIEAMEHHKRELERLKIKSGKLAQDLAKQMSGLTCVISRKSGTGAKIFGSITPADIVALLKKEGFSVERKQVHIPEPIKTLGTSSISVKLHPEVMAEFKLNVVSE